MTGIPKLVVNTKTENPLLIPKRKEGSLRINIVVVATNTKPRKRKNLKVKTHINTRIKRGQRKRTRVFIPQENPKIKESHFSTERRQGLSLGKRNCLKSREAKEKLIVTQVNTKSEIKEPVAWDGEVILILVDVKTKSLLEKAND